MAIDLASLPTSAAVSKLAVSSEASASAQAGQELTWEDFQNELDECTTWEQFWHTAADIFYTDVFDKERRNSSQPCKLNETFFLYLASLQTLPSKAGQGSSTRSYRALHHRDRAFGRLLSECVRQVTDGSRFSSEFSVQLLHHFSDQEPMPVTVDALADFMLKRFPPLARLTAGTSSTAGLTGTMLDPLVTGAYKALIKMASHAGKARRVDECFRALRAGKVQLDITTYQYQLIATAHLRTEDCLEAQKRRSSGGHDANDQRSHVDQDASFHNKILEFKTWMDEDNVLVNDKFLATVVTVMSAPARSPLSEYMNRERTENALQFVRSIGAQALANTQDKMGRSKTNRSMPHLFHALLSVQIDTLKTMLSSSDRTSEGATSSAVGPDALAPVDAAFAKVRIAALQPGVDEALPLLSALLDIPSNTPLLKTAEKRDIVLKQRSAVVLVFSRACAQRQHDPKHDSCLQVMRLVVEHPNFFQTWSRRQWPNNPQSPVQHADKYDPRSTLLRVWKRWLRAWSMDVLCHNSVQHHEEREHTSSSTERVDTTGSSIQRFVPYRTYAGKEAWKSLSRGCKLINQTLDQLGPIEPDLYDETMRDCELIDTVAEKATLDVMIRIALRGSRIPPSQRESMDNTPTNRKSQAELATIRLNHIFNLLERIGVKARIWDRVEVFLLRNISHMQRSPFTIPQVRDIVDDVRARRDGALRQRELTLLRQRKAKHHTLTDDTGFESESASVFVLRNLVFK